jgi:ABC-2 type transport system ATP-binding protein
MWRPTAAVVGSFYPSWSRSRFERLTADFGIPLRKRAGALSRGTRMKLALALALAPGPELLLLDEPTTGLDPVFRDDLLGRLSACIGNGQTSIVFSSQLMADLQRIADFVVLVRGGRVLHAGPKDDLLDRWAVVRGGTELATDLASVSRWPVAATPLGVEALLDDIGEARRRFAGRALVERATLDDVFLLCREAVEKDG